MSDGEKIFKALKLGKVTGLGCTLTSAECDYLIAHDDVLTQYITLLEKEQRWIPVEERLPEESDWTLIRYKGYRVPYTLYYDIDRGWACGETPDYWMSLPEMQEVNNE